MLKILGTLFRRKNKIPLYDKVVIHIRHQIDDLESQGHYVRINEITLAYFAVVIMSLSKKPIDLKELDFYVRDLYFLPKYREHIDHAFEILHSSLEDFRQKCFTLTPLITDEIIACKGKYLYKYTIWANKEVEAMFESSSLDYDPRNVKKNSFLDAL